MIGLGIFSSAKNAFPAIKKSMNSEKLSEKLQLGKAFPCQFFETGNFDILRNAPVYFREMGTLPSDGGKIGGF